MLLTDLDRLPRDNDELGAASRQPQSRFGLRNGTPLPQGGDGGVLARGPIEHIDLVGRTANDVFPRIAGHLQEPLVDLDVAQVGQPADDGRRGVGAEGALEALLRREALRHVLDHQHAGFRRAFVVGQHEAAQLLDAAPGLPVVGRRPGDFDRHFTEAFARQQPADRILVFGQRMVVSIFEVETLPVVLRAASEFGKIGDAVERKRPFIGPDDPVDGIDQHDALAESGDDLLELTAVDLLAQHRLVRHFVFHAHPSWRQRGRRDSACRRYRKISPIPAPSKENAAAAGSGRVHWTI